MPVLIPAAIVAASAAGAGVAYGALVLGKVVVSTILANAAIAAGATLVLTAASKLLAPKAPQQELRDRVLTVRNSIAPRRIIYGRARVGGAVLFLDTTPSTAGGGVDRNTFLTMVVALAGHEVSQVEEIYLDDDAITLDGSGLITAPSRYVVNGVPMVRVETLLGSDAQNASQLLIDGSEGRWTSAHRLRGIAALNVRLRANSDAFTSGIPNVSAVVRGKVDVFDPRTSTTGYSANPALCIRDYLLFSRERGGAGFSAADIDEASFIAAANICDESIPLAAGGTEPRYQVNGSIETDGRNSPANIVPSLLTACAGRLVWQGGTFRLIVGAYRAPTLTLTEADLAGSVQVTTELSRRDRFNAIGGTFIDPDAKWQPTEFPRLDAPTSADNNERISRSVTLPFTISSPMAQRLAKIELLKARQPITLSATFKLTALSLQVGDVVNLTLARFGWAAKPFDVVDWSFSVGGDGALLIEMSLRETDASVYDWDADEQAQDPAPNTNLPSPWAVSLPGLSLSERRVVSPGQVINVLVATIAPAQDAFVDRYEVQFRPSTGALPWRGLGEGDGTEFLAVGVLEGEAFEVRARSISFSGARSDWVTTTRTILGRVTLPPNVTGFAAATSGDVTALTWIAVSEPELSHYVVRYSPDVSALWGAMAVVVPRASGTLASVQTAPGRYAIKAVTFDGLESNDAAYAVAGFGTNNGYSEISSAAEHPTFAGSKTNTEVVSSTLRLTTGNTSGTYAFAATVDLGAVFLARITTAFEASIFERSGNWDDQSGQWDQQSGEWDGAALAEGASVRVEVRSTPDDPAGSPVWSAWSPVFAADIEARALQFRAALSSVSANLTPSVSLLTASVLLADRTESDYGITSSVSGTTITYAEAFQDRPAVSITPYDLASNDYYEVTASTRTGFEVIFKHGGSGVARVFDWIADGTGREV